MSENFGSSEVSVSPDGDAGTSCKLLFDQAGEMQGALPLLRQQINTGDIFIYEYQRNEVEA
jgi:hypothetical protein